MAMSTGSSGSMLTEINVTPLVDVMLVLLIIFMVTAPMLQTGVDVNLPQAKAQTIPDDEGKLILTVTKDKRVFLGKLQIPWDDVEKTEDGRPVSVVHVVAELAPFARTGGLGEAVKSLAEFQSAAGISTSIIMPLYRQVHSVAPNLEPVGEPFSVQLGPSEEPVRLLQIAPDRRAKGRPRVYFIDHPHFFDRPGMYGESGYDYPDNPRRYAYFSLAALTALTRVAADGPIILHAHDWHAALASVYLRTFFMQYPYYRQVRTVLSVHNAGFQGQYPARTMADVGLPWELFTYRHL